MCQFLGGIVFMSCLPLHGLRGQNPLPTLCQTGAWGEAPLYFEAGSGWVARPLQGLGFA